MCFAIQGQPSILRCITILHFADRPSAISRFIVSRAVDSVNTVFGSRRLAHVSEEVLESVPLTTDSNALAPVPWKASMKWILASRQHILPNAIDSLLGHAMCPGAFLASAALCVAAPEMHLTNDKSLSTVALAHPTSDSVSTFSVLRRSFRDDNECAISLSNKGSKVLSRLLAMLYNGARHARFLSNRVCSEQPFRPRTGRLFAFVSRIRLSVKRQSRPIFRAGSLVWPHAGNLTIRLFAPAGVRPCTKGSNAGHFEKGISDMQAPDGHMVGLNQSQFSEFMEHGALNICTVGDVFRVRRTYYRVENISDYGISAKGISRREYVKGKKRMHSRL
jgi:hypothetical protein